MNLLTTIDLQGFKSIREIKGLTLGPLNVLIGANGTGKSNLISFFKLLNWMTFAPDQLQFYIAKQGGANALLHDGAALTAQICARLAIQTDAGLNEYLIRLFYAAGDTLIFAEESYRFTRGDPASRDWQSLDSGHRESRLRERAGAGDQAARMIHDLLRRCVVYQFHNTTETARIKQRWQVDDGLFLRDDGANLAAVLYRLLNQDVAYYNRILATIRQVAPFFLDFVLEPNAGTVLLQWRERGTDLIFGPHQISDGTLRFMALVTLLLQPKESLPNLIILDEPELGLHPFAIDVLAGLLRSVSLRAQVLLATQSATLLNYFDPEEIIVVDRPGRDSTFTHLAQNELNEWLEEYTLSELWEKNVIGGRPA